MTIKPSDMPRGKGMQLIKNTTAKHQEKQTAFWEYYDQSIYDVEELYKYFEQETTNDPQAAATLTLAVIMNIEEDEP